MTTSRDNIISIPLPPPLRNVHNLLSGTVHLLATGRGTIRERLYNAYIREFHLIRLTPDALRDVDPRALELFREVDARMTSHPEEIAGEGMVAATIRHMSDDEAVDIAEKICELELRIESALRD